MKKKGKFLFLAGSLLLGAIALASCGSTENSGSASGSSSSPVATTATPSGAGSSTSSNTSSSTSTSVDTTQYVGFKVFLNGEEYSSTNNTLTYNFGQAYLEDLVVKAIKNDESLEEVTNYDITTDLDSTSRAGNYTASISFEEFEAVTINVVINKVDSDINSFDVASKVYDGKPCTATYDISDGATPNIYYKEKGADDSTYTDAAPVDCGNYIAKLAVDGGDEVNTRTCEFYILQKTISAPKSDNGSSLFVTFSTGSEQTLNLPSYVFSIFDVYEKFGEEYVKVDSLTNTEGTQGFKIVINNDNYTFGGTGDAAKEVEYTWVILPNNIVTSCTYGSESLTLNEFLALGEYKTVTCSFTTIDGYSAYIGDYQMHKMDSISDTSYSYFVIKYDDNIIYAEKLSVISSVIDGVTINGETYSSAEDITYRIKPTDNEITVTFNNATADCRYTKDDGVFENVPGSITLSKENHKIDLYKIENSSMLSICHIDIVLDDPIKSLDAIRYSFYEDRVFSNDFVTNSSGWDSEDTNGDFLIGVSVELNDGYEDCVIRLYDYDRNCIADFVNLYENLYTTNYYGPWSYLSLEILRDNKVIYSEQLTIDNTYITLDGAIMNNFDNRGEVNNVLLVTNSDRKCEFKLAGSNPGGKILVNGQENYVKVYESDGVYKEKITYINEICGQQYSVDFYCIVVVSEDSKNFGTLKCSYMDRENGFSYQANIYEADYGDSNVFNAVFGLYGIEKFDTNTVRAEEDDYTVKSAQMINDDVLGVTYIVATINDGTNDHVVYLLVQTDSSVGLSLNPIFNMITVDSNTAKSTSYQFDEFNSVAVKCVSGDGLYMHLESYANIIIVAPDGTETKLGFDGAIRGYSLTKKGTYNITLTNRKNESKTYTLVVEDFLKNLEISVGDINLVYESEEDNDFVLDYNNHMFIGYLGEASKSLIDNGKIEVTISGVLASNAYSDASLTNLINGTAKLDVLEDNDGKLYAMIYCLTNNSKMPIKLVLADKALSPLKLLVGDNEYDLGSDDDPGDFVPTPFGQMLIINDVSYDIYLTGNAVYTDYSYSLVLFKCEDIEFNQVDFDTSLEDLETAGYLYKVYDSQTLKTKIYFIESGAYGYVIPSGATGDEYLSKYVSSSDDLFVIYKSAYYFKTQVGKEDCYASVIYDGVMSVFMGGPKYDTSADDYEMSQYDGYTELYFTISDEELDDDENIDNGRFKLNLYSGFDIVGHLFEDSNHLNGVAYEFDPNKDCVSILLSIKTDSTTGNKYIEFYYSLGDDKAKVRFDFVPLLEIVI